MTTATLPMLWRGRSGREYVPIPGRGKLRHGELATVRKVTGRGGPVGTSVLAEGTPFALKLWREGEEASLDSLQEEARVLVELSSHGGEIPSPRLYDLVGDPLVTGLVMEWCPVDLERWWMEKLKEPDAFGRLAAAFAETARRLDEYHRMRQGKSGFAAAHGDVKPTNILLSAEGRWLVAGFGVRPFRPPEDEVWADSHMIVANENFVAPEVLFSARAPHPAAIDAWSLGASLFALVKLRRMVDEGAVLPFNGTGSPRFRSERVVRVFEVFGRDPRRFADRELDPDAFPDPLAIPEEDRRAVRDGFKGMFGAGADAEAREKQLAGAVLEILDRALSIDPAHRYTDCRDLAAAFEALTRTFIALSATAEPSGVTTVPDPVELQRVAEAERARNRLLVLQVAKLEAELRLLERRTPTPAPVGRVPAPPVWWGVALVVLVAMHVFTLLAVAVLVALQWGP